MSKTKDQQIGIDQLTGDNLEQIVQESCNLQLQMVQKAKRLSHQRGSKRLAR